MSRTGYQILTRRVVVSSIWKELLGKERDSNFGGIDSGDDQVGHPKWRLSEPWKQWTLISEVVVETDKKQRLDKWYVMGRFKFKIRTMTEEGLNALLATVRNLREKCVKNERQIYVALKATPLDLQDHLNQYMAKRMDRELLKSYVTQWTAQRWQKYALFLCYCRDNSVRLIACGTSLKILRVLQAASIHGLSKAKRKSYNPLAGYGFISGLYSFSRRSTIDVSPHTQIVPFGPSSYLWAQARVVQDHTMSLVILQAVADGDSTVLLLVATKANHFEYGSRGTCLPARFSRKLQKKNQVVVLLDPERQYLRREGETPIAYFLWYLAVSSCNTNCFDRTHIARVMNAAGDMLGVVIIYKGTTSFEKLAKTWKFKFKGKSDKSHLAEMTTPMANETQDGIVNAWFKIHVFSDFDMASWTELKIYGCANTKHILLLVKQANCGNVLILLVGVGLHHRKLGSKIYLSCFCGIHIWLTDLWNNKLCKNWRYKFKESTRKRVWFAKRMSYFSIQLIDGEHAIRYNWLSTLGGKRSTNCGDNVVTCREMSAAFYAAGFEPWDLTVSDLLGGDEIDAFLREVVTLIFEVFLTEAMIIRAWDNGEPSSVFGDDVFKQVLGVFITTAITKIGHAILDVILDFKAHTSMSLHVIFRYVLKVFSPAARVSHSTVLDT